MATGVACPPIILQFTLNNGQLAAGGSVLTQVGGINAATYQDINLATPLPNPINLNSRGEIANAAGISVQLFLTPNTVYVFTLFDGPNGTGNQINVATYVNGTQIALTQATIGLALYPQTAAESAAGVTPVNFGYIPGDVRRQGVLGNGSDETTKVQNALNVGGWVWIPKGVTVTCNSNLNIPLSGTTFQIDGVLALPTSRVIAYAVSSFHVIGDGTVQSGTVNNTDIVPAGSGWQGLGVVSWGGAPNALVTDFLWLGVELSGGFAGTPGTIAIINLDVRRGIAMTYCTTARVRRSRVHGQIAEAIWHGAQAGAAVSSDIEVSECHVYNNNHDCISPAETTVPTFRTRGNIMWNSLNGIEASIGTHEGNYAFNMIGSGYGFGGSNPNTGIDPVIFRNNVGRNNGLGGGGAIDFSFQGATTQQGNLIVQNNASYNSGAGAFFVSFMNNVTMTGNQANGWGQLSAGSAFGNANSNYIYIDDNHAYDEGPSSNGGLSNSALIQCIVGSNNTTRGVAIPYPLDTTTGLFLKPASVPCFSTPGTAALTGSTTPTTISACTIAANSMGRTGGIVITAGGTTTGVVGNKTINIQFGGSTACQLVIPAASTAAWFVRVRITGQGSTSGQLAIGEAIFNSTPQATAASLAINTTANVVASLQGTLVNSADTITVYSFSVEPFVGLTP